ncbi:SusC/RagA family TonB-linked outer membrane protein [Pedobacter caeni]|uniref:TonB-linked outer membrane protein, SusC/RagA family n=1 Tax=Pedobacter caeni TaxID=288992 RepID=A0A1M5EJ11_9SPHI|nr:SusC/RagA family TonB-linked outer membrane protein [Pedobacter caeni]SHF79229.1 TonB-linked outer membrane protein, SusC/RagA family [Pedobacter caeni]
MKKRIKELIKPGPAFLAGSILLGLGLNVFELQAATLAKQSVPLQLNPGGKAEIPVKGTVTDEKGLPLPGVSVTIKGSKTVVSTNSAGRFELNVATADAVLVFSYIGYVSKEVTVANQTNISIQLQPSNNTLQDVEIVSIGYGTISSKEVTSAVAHVDASQFRQGGARNPLDLIVGKVAGLQLSRSGSNPNSGISVQLRGAGTINGSSSPLFVIDGIPGGNPDLLQQDDIASIDILKDGSGAAIYGTSANAGVIIITTKKGKAGPATFNYASYFRKDYMQRRPDYLTADEYREKISSGALKQKDYGYNTDFYDQLINHDNFSQNQNLNLAGGTDKTSYRASLNYRDLEGISRENGREEYSLRLNITQKGLNDRLTAQLNLATNFNKANLLGGGGWESESAKNPTLSNYNPDGSYRFDLTSTNEFARLKQETNIRKQQTSSADGKIDLDIIDGLQASIFGAVTRNSYNDSQYRLKASEESMENSDFPGGGYGYKSSFLSQDFAVEPTLQYKKKLFDQHNISAVAGYSYRYHLEEGFSASNRGFLNDQQHEDNLNSGAPLSPKNASVGSFKNDNTLIAFFGRVNYAFNNKYLAQFILRREGSSKFGQNNKWATFPAVSVGWNLTEENFMKNHQFINFLKLRAGYGLTGNSGSPNNISRVTLGGGGKYLFPDGKYYETYGPDRNPNPNLKWETKRELNIGVDFKLFGERLTGAIDVFKRTTKDLLDTYTSPQPPYIRDFLYTNVGTISSKGIEIALSYNAIRNKDFTWNIDVTASTLSNKLDSYSNDVYKVKFKTFGTIGGAGALGDAYTTYEGGKIGVFYGKRFAGFTPDGKWLFYNRNGEAVRNDQINNSRDDLNATDLAPIGNAVPKYYASWNNSFTYKNFDLRIFLRGKFDFDILNTSALSYGNKTWSGNLLRDAFGKFNQIDDTYMYTDYYIEKGSFVKLDEVTLGYTFKFKTNWLRKLNVYVTGQNLATFTKYSGNDPDYVLDNGLGNEINGQRLGIDSRGPYPSTRSFLVGLNVGF